MSQNMQMKIKIRTCLFYEYKLGTKAKEATDKICSVFGNDCLKVRVAHFWYKKFKNGHDDLNDEERCGRLSELDDDLLKNAIEANTSLSCRELADQFDVCSETVRTHLKSIGKTWKLSRWVPHKLTELNKLNRFNICASLLARNACEGFVDYILTCDEKWVWYTNTRRGHQWLSPNDPVEQTPKKNLHAKKILLCVWWSKVGVIHQEFLKPGETIDAKLYSSQLSRVQKALIIKQPALTNRNKVVFLQDNARPHTAILTQKKIVQLKWDLLPHPPYSPDISPSDYYLFLSLDNHMRNKNFDTADGLQTEILSFFQNKPPEFYKRGIDKLPDLWQKVVDNNGDYFDE